MKKGLIIAGLIVALAVVGWGSYLIYWNYFYEVVEVPEYIDPDDPNTETYTIERTTYRDPKPTTQVNLTDDRLQDKKPAFDESIIDRRSYDGWQVNKSAAVIKLDCPLIKPDQQPELLKVYANYAEALQAAKRNYDDVLPSLNLIDGAAKQFDDGLYAAIDLACFQGKIGPQVAAPQFVEGVFQKLPENHRARAFLAGALQIANVEVELTANEIKWRDKFVDDFNRDRARSKPIAFYTWNDELKIVYRFFRYLQKPFVQDMTTATALAAAVHSSEDLKKQYNGFLGFYSQLTNPYQTQNLNVFLDSSAQSGPVAFLPASTSRENELLLRLFGNQPVPESTHVMILLINKIRNGDVDLAIREKSGWYDRQIFALETMLLPERGVENEKLLLTRKYKKRLLEAFQALMTKRRETHVRQLATGEAKSEAPPEKMSPRLRVEPNPTFYLRTARAYDFLLAFLTAADDNGVLAEIEGLRKTGSRGRKLGEELKSIRDRFYGFYLVSCEDIGLKPELNSDEAVDQQVVMAVALKWLENMDQDLDLACDTRVSVPIFISINPLETILWGTFGVRFAQLEVSYARPPSIRKDENDEWEEVNSYRLEGARYLISVDEFGEFRLPGRASLTRSEFRKVLDDSENKVDAIEKLSNR